MPRLEGCLDSYVMHLEAANNFCIKVVRSSVMIILCLWFLNVVMHNTHVPFPERNKNLSFCKMEYPCLGLQGNEMLRCMMF
jgi:hypothetical protein